MSLSRSIEELEFQLIPVRGRKLENLLQELTEAFDFNLSPQGDGNSKVAMNPLGWTNFNLSPQGDGNLFTPSVSFAAMTFQLIPARGQKTPHQKKMRSFSFACLNFSVFVGFFSMNRAAAAFSLPWLLYCDKMCYNRAKLKHLSQNTQLYSSFVVQLFHNL